MLKTMKRGVVMGSGSASYGFDEVRARLVEHQRMKQQYSALLMEIKAKKKNLQRANKRKLTLKAEVRFLKRRYDYLMSIRSPTPLLEQDLPRIQVPKTHREALPMEKVYRDREAAVLNSALVFDLNQISMGEEDIEIPKFVEPLRMVEKSPMKVSVSRGGKPPLPPRRSSVKLPRDVKFSVCRDIGKGTSQTGKRKMPWQDPVALRV